MTSKLEFSVDAIQFRIRAYLLNPEIQEYTNMFIEKIKSTLKCIDTMYETELRFDILEPYKLDRKKVIDFLNSIDIPTKHCIFEMCESYSGPKPSKYWLKIKCDSWYPVELQWKK